MCNISQDENQEKEKGCGKYYGEVILMCWIWLISWDIRLKGPAVGNAGCQLWLAVELGMISVEKCCVTPGEPDGSMASSYTSSYFGRCQRKSFWILYLLLSALYWELGRMKLFKIEFYINIKIDVLLKRDILIS